MPVLREMGTEMVKTITVCLAVYNGMPYLRQQILSLQQQDDRDFRVLIQDDGSQDGSQEFLQEITGTDTRFHFGAHQGCHLGPAGNFLDLCRQGTGYIAPCDQDDIWAHDKLTVERKAMEQAEFEHPGTPVLVHSDLQVIDAEGNPLFPSMFKHQGWDFSAVRFEQLLVQNNVTGCTMLINEPLRQLISHAQADQLFMHDWFIAQTASAFGIICPVRQPLVSYRQHEHNQIGASEGGTLRRTFQAFSKWNRTKKRLEWNYKEAKAFKAVHEGTLSSLVQSTLDRFLEIEHMPKYRRAVVLLRGGFLMQSTATRIGQLLLT